MNILYIYSGKSNKKLTNHADTISNYCLDSGKLIGDNVVSINDNDYLNKIATNNVDFYAEFIFSQNEKFIKNKLIYKNKLSLYFLTDMSCKRSEVFSTYSDYCNALFLKKFLKKNKIDHVVFDGCSNSFFSSLKLIIKGKSYSAMNLVFNNVSMQYVILKNMIFYFKLSLGITIQKLFIKKHKQSNHNIDNLFLTRYPLHLNNNFYEDKYGDFVNKSDTYLVNLFTDGLHQDLSIRNYYKFSKLLSMSKRVEVLDNYLEYKDIFKSFFYSIFLIIKYRVFIKDQFQLNEIDLTENVMNELNFSLIRVPRLLVWEGPIKKFIQNHEISKFHYYLHEYSYGRFFTFMFDSFSKQTHKIGFQHGPSSMRKMVYMTAKKELQLKGDGIYSFPTPDEVLSEDVFSKEIYIHSGYSNVKIMDKVYRLNYLNKVVRKNSKQNLILIAPGLHDGEYLLHYLKSLINQDNNNYILKPHPRANNSYIDSLTNIKNLSIVDDDVDKLLSKVSKVIATYSSIAIEAYILGINIELVEMPGKINESPLIDKNFLINAEKIKY
jgi:hypothetical protein